MDANLLYNPPFEVQKLCFALILLLFFRVVHLRISQRVGNPLSVFVIGRNRWIDPIPKRFRSQQHLVVVKKSVENRDFGNRVVLGELFSLLCFSIGILVFLDAFVDVFPSLTTSEIFFRALPLQELDDPALQGAFENLLTVFVSLFVLLGTFTFALIFYIMNSERVTDQFVSRGFNNTEAANSLKHLGASVENAGDVMKKSQTGKLSVATVEELEEAFRDPDFRSKMTTVGERFNLKLTAEDVAETDAFKEFLTSRKS
jgi:hypothetical protein